MNKSLRIGAMALIASLAVCARSDAIAASDRAERLTFQMYVKYIVNERPVTEEQALAKLKAGVRFKGKLRMTGNSYERSMERDGGIRFTDNVIITKIDFMGDAAGRINTAIFYVALRPCLSAQAVWNAFGAFPIKDVLSDWPPLSNNAGKSACDPPFGRAPVAHIIRQGPHQTHRTC